MKNPITKQSTTPVRINQQQLRMLSYIYKFRFVSTKQLQVILAKKQVQQIQQRLNLLLQRQYVGRNFTNLDRLTGRYASYYLLPKGMKVLKHYAAQSQATNSMDASLFVEVVLNPLVLHNIYKDKTASTRFINHCLRVGDIYCDLLGLYSDRLTYFSKGELVNDNYFPAQRPDAYLRLTHSTTAGVAKNSQSEFFLEYLEEIVPFFVYRNRIKQYEAYAEEEAWEAAIGEAMPAILLVCETAVLQRRVLRYLKKQLENSYADNLVFLVTTKEALATAHASSLIWVETRDGEPLVRGLS